MNATGTVKVGRWTYPATLAIGSDGFPRVTYNTKRDGSGETKDADTKTADTYVADEVWEYEVPEGVEPKALTGVVEPPPASEDHGNSADFEAARQIYAAVFNNFALASSEMEIGSLTQKRTLEIAFALLKYEVPADGDGGSGAALDGPFPLLARIADGDYKSDPVWQSWLTHDNIDIDQALANFDLVVPRDLVVKERKVVKPVNNTHAKPGRSTWVVGTPCPQGHTLEEGDVYVMPSGRRQCRKCRAGYASNI